MSNSYAQGVNVDAHFGKKGQWQEKAQQYKRGEERRISKVRKTIKPKWQEWWYTSPQNNKKTLRKANGSKGAPSKWYGNWIREAQKI